MDHVVHLHYLPAFILVKLNNSRAPRFGKEEQNVITICPIVSRFRLSVREDSKRIARTISRKQLPLAAAYALTDYRAQGQTLPAVIVDLAPPPTDKLNLLHTYVALSRSKGCDTICLLRHFDEGIFLSPQLPQLAREDERLARLNKLLWLLETRHAKRVL